MNQPATKEEYERRYKENTRIEGFGADTKTIMACPFCAAPDFMVFPVTAALNEYADVCKPHTCKECGRTMTSEVNRTDGGVTMSFAQTGGDDPPAWVPMPRK